MADPVRRRAIWISSAMLANCVRNTQMRNGGDSNPKSGAEDQRRTAARSACGRCLRACGLNRTCMRSRGACSSSRSPSQAKSSSKNHIFSASQCTARQNSMGETVVANLAGTGRRSLGGQWSREAARP